MSQKYIITVPHACIKKRKIRTCDLAANAAALELYKLLGKQSVILFGNIERSRYLDLNRKNSRKTTFRIKVTKLLQSSFVEWLLDVHSFPTNNDKEGMKGEVAFLYLDKDETYLFELIKYLKSYKIDTNFYRGSFLNDIIVEARSHQIKYLLIEFNEDLLQSRLIYICQKIVDFMS